METKNEGQEVTKNKATDMARSIPKLQDQISALEKNISKLRQKSQYKFLQQNKGQHNQLESLSATVLSLTEKIKHLDHRSNLCWKNVSTLFNKMSVLEQNLSPLMSDTGELPFLKIFLSCSNT